MKYLKKSRPRSVFFVLMFSACFFDRQMYDDLRIGSTFPSLHLTVKPLYD
jgi:hypothetical protein